MEASVEHNSSGGDSVTCKSCGHEQLLFGPKCVECGHQLTLTETPPPAEEDSLSHYCEESYPGEFSAASSSSPIAATMEMTPEEEEPEPVAFGIDGYGLISLGIGLAAAIVSLLFFWPLFIFGHLSIAIHEFGHAAAGWIFGYFSIPSFDFVFGGGITISSERIWLIVAIVYFLFALAAWFVRDHKPLLAVLGATVVIYTALMLTSWHEALIIGIGHGMELIFGGIFLYRAFGNRTIMAAVERPIYAFLGFFLLIYNGWLAWRLMTEVSFRQSYLSAKGELLAMDYTRLAYDYWNVSLKTVALIFFILTIVTLIISWALAVFRRQLIYPILGE